MTRIKKKHRLAQIKSRRQVPAGTQEYICQCPRCLTVETLWFGDGVLVPTTRFSQREDGRIYHHCNQGSAEPCRLFPKRRVKPQISWHK